MNFLLLQPFATPSRPTQQYEWMGLPLENDVKGNPFCLLLGILLVAGWLVCLSRICYELFYFVKSIFIKQTNTHPHYTWAETEKGPNGGKPEHMKSILPPDGASRMENMCKS